MSDTSAASAPVIELHRGGTSPVQRAIQWQRNSPYHHASMVLRDGRGVESVEGVGVHLFDPATYDADRAAGRVETYHIDGLTDAEADAIEAFWLAQVGKRYDYGAIVWGFLFRRRRTEDDVWFCSELAYAGPERAGVALLARTEAWEVAPDVLARSPRLLPSALPSSLHDSGDDTAERRAA